MKIYHCHHVTVNGRVHVQFECVSSDLILRAENINVQPFTKKRCSYTVGPLLSGHLLNFQPLLNGQLSNSKYQYNTVKKTPIKRPVPEGGRLTGIRLYI